MNIWVWVKKQTFLTLERIFFFNLNKSKGNLVFIFLPLVIKQVRPPFLNKEEHLHSLGRDIPTDSKLRTNAIASGDKKPIYFMITKIMRIHEAVGPRIRNYNDLRDCETNVIVNGLVFGLNPIPRKCITLYSWYEKTIATV